MFEDIFLNYFRYGTDDQWTRTNDFTPSASIGQSSIICLEVPQLCDLPNIGDYFLSYKEYNLDFECQNGYSYSCGSSIVPLVKSPNNIDVPFEILFKINHLVQLGTLSGPTLDDNFFCLVSPKFVPTDHIKRALLNMSYLKSICLNPTDWLSAEYSKICKLRYTLQTSPQISPDDGLVYVHRVQVTPAKVYFYGQEINVSNCVVRHFSADIDNFIRISFVDKDYEKLRSADLSPRSTSRNGTRRTALSEITASDVRKWMGDFRNIRNVAKYAARLGQSFSASTETLKVHKYEVEELPDIKMARSTYSLMELGRFQLILRVAMKCKLVAPSVFQIRYGGYKGVVAVDPRSNWKLSMRKSMLKFQSENITLDALAYSKYQPCFLNQQLITLLSTLGVSDSVFESKQEEAVRQLNRMVTEPQAAIEAIELMPMGEVTNVVKELLLCGYQPDHEPYLSMLLQTFRASKLQELKTKFRIFIPSGRAMIGCLDETRTLKYGQAVNVPDLHHMFDCVVFPQQGPR
ncbi:RNA-dependent RNA polymerase 1 [Dichanthelium oligosanthes]|uniref:RNA-dependent RNA polymerase n=1 Tax=Dichanthelium oligosanthes TaxID=888268 RepID=A0A1E5WEG0_9POAL|nr:RNA-dependent RNA polymerase 1 [Dichanthelium oligosanthes]